MSHFNILPQPKPITFTFDTLRYTFQDNVCTHSYSYVWYSEKEWTQHIDEMALKGINMFYAITGK